MNAIDYSKLRSLTAGRLMSALQRDGFLLVHTEGSHYRFRHPDGRRVTVTFHRSSQTFPPKTLRRMIEEQTRWTVMDLKRLKLLTKHDP